MAEFSDEAGVQLMPQPGWKMAALSEGMVVTDWKVVDHRMSATWVPTEVLHVDGLVLWDGKPGPGHRLLYPVDVPMTVRPGSDVTLTWYRRPYGG